MAAILHSIKTFVMTRLTFCMGNRKRIDPPGGGGYRLRRSACMTERAVGDLGGVKESGSVGTVNGFDEHAVRRAGDKVADVLRSGERGHGAAVG